MSHSTVSVVVHTVLVTMLAILASLFNVTAAWAIPSTERAALIALYDAMGGANWTNHSGWRGVAGTECSWYGVTCHNGRVTKLELQNNQLSGSIPPEIGQLTHLETLNLRFNQITGIIPGQIGLLTNLQYLYLYSNQISGGIPSAIGSLKALRHLYLNDNQILGSIPTHIRHLTRLQSLNLKNNQISGDIPSIISSLTQLHALYLDGNQLKGLVPTTITSLINLKVLQLADNCLYSHDQALITWLSNLDADWQNNQRGDCPGFIASPMLSVNKIGDGSGTVNSSPAAINCGNTCSALITQGSSVNLVASAAFGSIFGGWSGACTGTGNCTVTMEQSRSVTAHFNSTSMSIPAQERFALIALYNTTNGANWINQSGWLGPAGTECNWYGVSCRYGQVTGLKLDSNQLQGFITPEIGKLTELQSLDLGINQLGGIIPVEIGQLVQLQRLVLHNNQITGIIPKEIQNLTQLQHLSLNTNQLTGNIPPEIRHLTQLNVLSLSNNQLTQFIPAEIGQLLQLKQLELNNNQLRDFIPSSITQLYDLVTFKIDNNCLLTNDPVLNSFISYFAPNWQNSQTNNCPGMIPNFPLTISKTGTGSGTVSSNPVGINCGSTCSAQFADGTSVTLTALPASGSSFTGWAGACSGTGSCTVTMNQVRSVTATFGQAGQSTLTVNRTGTGSGTVSSNPAGINCGSTCSAQFADGTSVTLTALPASGSSFTGWAGACSGTGSCTVTMQQDYTISAHFNLTSDHSVTDREVLQQYYLAYYGRPADLAGFNYWLSLIQAASNSAARLAALDTIRASFGSPSQPEFVSIYGQRINANEFFDRAYANIFNRIEGNTDARNYWLSILNAQTQAHQNKGLRLEDAQAYARADLLSLMINATLAHPGTRDYTTFNNKQLMAAHATGRLAQLPPSTQTGFLNAVKSLLANPQIHTLSVAQLYAAVDALLPSTASIMSAMAGSIPTWTSTTLTWSQLPQGLQALLSTHHALISPAQSSADGSVIVFATEAALVWQDDNEYSDIYAYDLDNDRLTLISINHYGHAANAPSEHPHLAADGQTVIYLSTATDLVSGPQNAYSQLYQYHRFGDTTTRLTATATGQPGNGDTTSAIIAGDWIIYATQATNLDAEGSGLYRHHRYIGQRELIGRDRWGQADPQASHPAATADGELIAYQRPDDYGRQHIYLTDSLNVERISLHADTELGLLDHCCAALSHDGQFIAYREQDIQGSVWLHILNRDTAHFIRLPWPEALEQAPQFSHDGAELWWINTVQGLRQTETIHQTINSLLE